MKQKFFGPLNTLALFLSLALPVRGQFCPPANPGFTNRGTYVIPGNNSQFDVGNFVNAPGGSFVYETGLGLFYSSNTTNFINQGTMTGVPGFEFDTFPNCGSNPQARPASNFINQPVGFNSGIIQTLGLFSFNIIGQVAGNLTGSSKVIISANNVTNQGTISMDASSLIKITGKNVDLSYGGLNMTTPLSTVFFGTNVGFALLNSGILDGYWGARASTNGFAPASLAGNFTPPHLVTNRDYLVTLQTLFLPVSFSPPSPKTFGMVTDTSAVDSNRFTQVVFFGNVDPGFNTTAYIYPFQLAAQWQFVATNWPFHATTTNYVYLTDNFGEVTNIGVAIDGFVIPQGIAVPTYKPINYQFNFGNTFFTNLSPGGVELTNGTFATVTFGAAGPPVTTITPGLPPLGLFTTNEFAAYEGLFTTATELAQDVANFNVTNLAGRIEITADTLKLNQSRITALNYLQLKATNHFAGSPGAMVSSPNSDINLRTTNGTLTVTNLMAPFLPTCSGLVNLWSGRWTNVVNSITNSYHVLFVDSGLSPITQPLIQTLFLNVTNTAAANSAGDLFINDVLNVTTNLVLAAKNLTVTTNDPDSSFAPVGQVNLVGPGVLYATNFPGLQNLTNFGQITAQNDVSWGTPTVPLQSFVNHGTLFTAFGGFTGVGGLFGFSSAGLSVWSKYIEDDGLFAAAGSLLLQKANSVVLSNGLLYAINGIITINSGSLLASNQFIYTGGLLDLWITNSLSDGGGALTNGNSWQVGGIMNLNLKPPMGDLLSTTILNVGPPWVPSISLWAALDRGATVAGYSNNCALGRLILDGTTNTLFIFSPVGVSNALYVDDLELMDLSTNLDNHGNVIGLSISPGMKLYYAQAKINGASIAEKLNGKNGGQLIWVKDYAGTFSSTNILNPDGTISTVNKALRDSCTIDSDGDGLVNCIDLFPFSPPPVQLNVSVQANTPPAKPQMRLSWQTFANSTNHLDYKGSLTSTNWMNLTNFVFGPVNGQATVMDTMTSSNRCYRVRVDLRRQ